MIPLNFVESLTRTFSLLVRLFGNVMSGVFVIGIVLSLAGLLVPIPLMALDLLTGAVQAYIFAVLAMVFIAGAIERSRRQQGRSHKGGPHELAGIRQHHRRRHGRVLRRHRAGAGRGPRGGRGHGRHRPPAEAADTISRTLFVGLAMIETTAIYCLVIALLLLFANPLRRTELHDHRLVDAGASGGQRR